MGNSNSDNHKKESTVDNYNNDIKLPQEHPRNHDVEMHLPLAHPWQVDPTLNHIPSLFNDESNKPVLPSPILTKDDFTRTWFLWKNQFLIYMKSIDQAERNKQKWGMMLLNRIGPFGQEIYRTFPFDKDYMKEDIDTLLKKFDLYCIFGSRRREDDEEIDTYVNNLMIMVSEHTNNTEVNTEQILKEKILIEINEDKFIEKAKILIPNFLFSSGLQLLSVKEITYIWMSYENTGFNQKEQLIVNNIIKNCNCCGNIHKVQNCPAYGKRCNKCGNINHYGIRCPSQYVVNCFYCGEDHFYRQCYAYGNICNNCHKPNHFSWKCSFVKILNCNFCGLTHIASKSECPAINSICPRCYKRGHFISKCKWRK